MLTITNLLLVFFFYLFFFLSHRSSNLFCSVLLLQSFIKCKFLENMFLSDSQTVVCRSEFCMRHMQNHVVACERNTELDCRTKPSAGCLCVLPHARIEQYGVNQINDKLKLTNIQFTSTTKNTLKPVTFFLVKSLSYECTLMSNTWSSNLNRRRNIKLWSHFSGLMSVLFMDIIF